MSTKPDSEGTTHVDPLDADHDNDVFRAWSEHFMRIPERITNLISTSQLLNPREVHGLKIVEAIAAEWAENIEDGSLAGIDYANLVKMVDQWGRACEAFVKGEK